MQKLRNLANVIAFTDEFQNLELAIAKPVDGVGFTVRRFFRKFCDDLRRHCRAEIRTTAKDFVNCPDHIGHRFMFHDVSVRAGAKGA